MNYTTSNKYRCNCGCNLDFIENKLGIDIYIGNNWIITINALANYRWNDYIRMNEFKVWQELREDIILNYNHSLMNESIKNESIKNESIKNESIKNESIKNESIKAADAPWVHLYNVNVAGEEHIPLNETLYYDCVY